MVFEVDGKPYTWLDVVLAADARGEWPRFEAMGLAGLDAGAADPSEAEVEQGLVAFRRRRDLLTAEEAERWLATFDLARDSWRAAVRRSLRRARQQGPATQAGAAPSIFASSLPPAVWWPDAVVSGALEEWARRGAEDLALVESDVSPTCVRSDAPVESPLPAPSWLASRPDAWTRRAHFAAVAARAREVEDAAATPDAVREAFAAHPLDWTSVAIELLSLPTEAAAREALLCHRLDGEPLGDVAKRSGVAPHTLECRIEDLPPDLRVPCVGARVGDLVGPLARHDGFSVLRVARREPPSEEDASAVSHARTSIVGRIRRRALRERVRFLLAVEPR